MVYRFWRSQEIQKAALAAHLYSRQVQIQLLESAVEPRLVAGGLMVEVPGWVDHHGTHDVRHS